MALTIHIFNYKLHIFYTVYYKKPHFIIKQKDDSAVDMKNRSQAHGLIIIDFKIFFVLIFEHCFFTPKTNW